MSGRGLFFVLLAAAIGLGMAGACSPSSPADSQEVIFSDEEGDLPYPTGAQSTALPTSPAEEIPAGM
ncbi:MAG: hypothetical protein ACOYXO_07250 [Chloroflexota bacterium]